MNTNTLPKLPPVYCYESKLAMRMIVHDMTTGRVPSTAATFSELHDYVDANDYLLTAVGHIDFDGDSDSEAELALANVISDEVDWWLRHLGDRSSAAAVRAQAPVI